MITGDQLKAARKLLGWSQLTLAAETGLDPVTIALFETGKREMSDGNRWKVMRSFQDAGVTFSDGKPVRRAKR